MTDNIRIEVLPDGRIKFTTDAISGPNHASAEQFLKYVATLAGGETTRERRTDVKHQTHTHDHVHDREHQH